MQQFEKVQQNLKTARVNFWYICCSFYMKVSERRENLYKTSSLKYLIRENTKC